MEAKNLPIRAHAHDLLELLKTNDFVVVIGEAGSGKTTQIPQILLEAGYADSGAIGITQPRRVAAISAARRVAEETSTSLGTEVGYTVRFDDMSSADTRIKYLTDGTLLRECLSDPELERYSVVMLDEAHERSLSTDILFGVIRDFQKTRSKPLKILITSATLDGEKFSKYFGDCPVLSVPGSCFPVEIIHSTEDHLSKYVDAAVDVVFDIHENQPPGDILLFMTGQAEIQKVVARINDGIAEMPEGACGPLQVLPLYAALPIQQQALVFSPCPEGCRRCIVATNIAETSITVDGVVYVVDPGTVKQKIYNPETGMDSLDVVTISRVQAKQRAGRAGRTRKGVCYRLYSKGFYDSDMAAATTPEIQRTSLVSAVLFLKTLDMNIDVLGFNYLDPPEVAQLEDALRQLYVHGAIDADGKITELGLEMARFPVDPSLAHSLIAAKDLGCVDEMVTVAAMLSVENVFYDRGGQGSKQNSERREMDRPGKEDWVSGFVQEGLGDHLLFLKVYQAWERKRFSKGWCEAEGLDFRAMRFARDVRNQLDRMTKEDSRRSDAGKWEKNASRDDRKKKRKTASNSGREPTKRARIDVNTAIRKALTLGFANRIAHRMAVHNGYRPMNPGSSLAQLHPTSAKIAADDEGLLPEWIIYHEHVGTSRSFLRKVCPVEGEWVRDLLPRIRDVDVKRLSGGATTDTRKEALLSSPSGTTSKNTKTPAGEVHGRRNSDLALSDARKRYLERKAAKSKQ
ncbi:hypothetical protein BSKO_02014 [Bryopsis sp. KO-2023]|nr:hypothetical protein BSKO_02014 [Bryopsis sp. KO-2023]